MSIVGVPRLPARRLPRGIELTTTGNNPRAQLNWKTKVFDNVMAPDILSKSHYNLIMRFSDDSTRRTFWFRWGA